MKILEYLFDQPVGATNIVDSSGQGNDGQINPVTAPSATPAQVVDGFAPPGYAFKSLRFSVDDMPLSPAGGPEPDNQLQFLGVPVTPSILNINNTRSFTVSFWAYHEALPRPGGNPWDSPETLNTKDLFCPQHVCGAEAFYFFVRTKNIGTSVPVSERGELAFTGDGPAIVQAGGIDTTGLGGTTSQGYHVPINTWVHIAGVLRPPLASTSGKWQIYVDGVLRGELDALPGLGDPTTQIFSTDAGGNPRPGVDIRFGNFRGDFAGGVSRPAPIAPGANDYAFNGYLTGIRMYDHAQTAEEICADISADTGTPVVTLLDTSVDFGAVAEGRTTVRPIRLRSRGCRPVSATMSDPGGRFGRPLGNAVSISGAATYDDSNEGTLWISYTAGSAGDVDAAFVTVAVADTGDSWTVPITARTIARPSVSAVLVLDRSASMRGNTGIAGVRKVDLLRSAATTFVDAMRPGDRIGVVRFDDNAPPPHFPLTDVGPELIGAGRVGAQNYIAGPELNPAGNTSIGDGVFAARGLLAGNTDVVQAIVVLTDGNENRSLFLADIEDELDEQTFAIGLGTPANTSAAALDRIVGNTGGYQLITGQIDNDNQFRLVKYYLQILSAISNDEIVVDPQGIAVRKTPQEIPFTINETDLDVDVFLLSPQPWNIEFTLVSPGGQKITPAEAAMHPNIRFVPAKECHYYRMSMPALVGEPLGHLGRWRALVGLSPNFDPVNEEQKKFPHAPFAVVVQARSDLRLRARLVQSGFELGEELTLSARITEYDLPVDDRFKVEAELTSPGGERRLLGLDFAGDGRWVAKITDTLEPGVYTARVVARGRTLRGQPAEREQTATGAILRGGGQRPAGEGPLAEILDHLRRHKRCSEARCRALRKWLESGQLTAPKLRRQLEEWGIDAGLAEELLKQSLKSCCGK